jgi:hypothetical protein
MLMHTGSRGSDVVRLQKELKAAGLNVGADGVFGNQTKSAVERYQRQHHLTADGVVGDKTWHALMTDGFTPGTPSRAKAPSHGTPSNTVHHTPAPSSSHAAKVARLLTEARSHLGFHEGAGNNNPFSHALGRPSEAWCADFVSYCAGKAGLHMNTASAQGVADILKSRGQWKGRANPQPGDAVTFRWDGTHGRADHVGMVERVYRQNGHTYIQTIEGNSSDSVRRNTYRADAGVINGYGTLS